MDKGKTLLNNKEDNQDKNYLEINTIKSLQIRSGGMFPGGKFIKGKCINKLGIQIRKLIKQTKIII